MSSSIIAIFSSNYIPYGIKYATIGKEEFMYTGKPYDTATGLYYEGARYYDPSNGRFVTQDSYSGDRNDPMTMNLYVYARDNPERYVDPSGHVLLSSYRLYGGGAEYNPTPTTNSKTTSTDYDYQKHHVWASTTSTVASVTSTTSTVTATTTTWTTSNTVSTNTYSISGPNPPQTTYQSCVWVPVPVIGIGLLGVDSGVPSGFWGWTFFIETNFGPVNFPFAFAAVPIGDCGQPNIPL
jgi:RHS repeat-associated protein